MDHREYDAHSERDPADDAPQSFEDAVHAESAPLVDVGREGHQSAGRWLLELILTLLAAYLLATGIKAYVVRGYAIPSPSMVPTLQVGDVVAVDRLTYRFRDPAPGDIVVFPNPALNPTATPLIKRIVAVGGQTVDLRDGEVWVDGVRLDEPYLVEDMPTEARGSLEFPFTVPEGKLLVMGDNRTNSEDGRFFGPVQVDDVVGRAFFIYWPPARWHGL